MIEYKGKQVTIMSCSNCNANCEHCYISYSGNLSGEQLLSMCKNFKDKYKIIINGTEVLLHSDYFESLKLSNQSRILTNGLIIYKNPDILRQVQETGIANIAMSYHFGTDISTVPQRIVEECIKIIKTYGLNPELMCTITSDNYNNLDYICEQAIELGVMTIRLFNCINTGKCETNCSDLCLTDEQLKEFFKNLREVRNKYPREVLKIKRNGLFGRDVDNERCNFSCNAGIDEVVITPDLNVYPCIFMTREGYEIGKYIDGKIMLYNELINNGELCIAHEVFNKKNEEAFTKILTKR